MSDVKIFGKDENTFKTVLKDSGTRDTFITGAVRDAEQGKGRFDLLPTYPFQRIAKMLENKFDLIPYWPIYQLATVFEAGAIKYAPRNWEKGIPLHRFLDSGLRHLYKWFNGHRDENHLHQGLWNFVCLSQTAYWILDGKLPQDLITIPEGCYKTIVDPPFGNKILINWHLPLSAIVSDFCCHYHAWITDIRSFDYFHMAIFDIIHLSELNHRIESKTANETLNDLEYNHLAVTIEEQEGLHNK